MLKYRNLCDINHAIIRKNLKLGREPLPPCPYEHATQALELGPFACEFLELEHWLPHLDRVITEHPQALYSFENVSQEIYERAVKINVHAFQTMPVDLMTDEIVKYVLNKIGYYLKFVPLHLQTYENCFLAVSKFPPTVSCCLHMLDQFPVDFIDHIVSCYPFSIKHVEQTVERCMMAIKSIPWAIEYIQNPTEEMCLMAMRLEPFVASLIELDTPDIRAMKQELATNTSAEKMATECIASDEDVLWKRLKHPTCNFCSRHSHSPYWYDKSECSLAKYPSSMTSIKEIRQYDFTPAMIQYIIDKKYFSRLRHAKHIPQDLYDHLFEKYPGKALKYNPCVTTEMYDIALSKDPTWIKYVPPTHSNWENYCYRILESDPLNIYYIQEPTKDMKDYAVNNNPWVSYILEDLPN